MSKVAELKRDFKKTGCRFDHEGTNHEIWYSPITDDYFPMSRHNGEEVGKKLEAALRRQAGVPKKR